MKSRDKTSALLSVAKILLLSNLYTVVSVDSYQDPSENWQQGSTKKSMNTSCCIYMSSTIWNCGCPVWRALHTLSSAITKTVTAVDRNAPSKETGFNRHQDVQPPNSDQSYHSIKPKTGQLIVCWFTCFVCFVNLKLFWNTNKNNFAFVCDTIIVNPKIISCHLMA